MLMALFYFIIMLIAPTGLGRLLCTVVQLEFLSNNLYFTQVLILQALKPTSK